MQTHNLQKSKGRIRSRSVGRGGKRGKTSGRGTKGQKARAGRKIRPEIRDFIKRLPKLRGRGKNSFKSIQNKPFAVNLSELFKLFPEAKEISRENILQKKNWPAGSAVKILADGEAKAVSIKGCAVSLPAKAKLEKAGGKIVS